VRKDHSGRGVNTRKLFKSEWTFNIWKYLLTGKPKTGYRVGDKK
jgi:hypothetical protein